MGTVPSALFFMKVSLCRDICHVFTEPNLCNESKRLQLYINFSAEAKFWNTKQQIFSELTCSSSLSVLWLRIKILSE